MRIIVYHLRLYALLIVTGIPHSVAIGIVYQPGSVFAGIQIVELRSPVNHRTPAKNFILIIQQFDKSDRICSGYVEEHITVFFDLTNLEGLLYLIGKQPVNAMKSCGIDGKFILASGFPIIIEVIAAHIERIMFELKRNVGPYRIYFLAKMNSRTVKAGYRFFKSHGDIIEHVHRRRSVCVYRQELSRFRLIVFLLFLFRLFFLHFLCGQP